MEKFVPVIWEAVRNDAAAGNVVDVDAYCERFATMRPDLCRKDIQDVVLKAVAAFGGGASWSADRSRMNPDGS